MITAKEAKKISEDGLTKHFKFIEKEIIDAANNNYCSVIIRDEPYCDLNTFMPHIAQKILNILELHGFEARFFYNEEGKYVDGGLLISWYDSLPARALIKKQTITSRKKTQPLNAIDRLSKIYHSSWVIE
ncbi:hypothetical protein [Arsenophonus sp. PmNCSU2021_1]|uniref:hypothetical protein n=1 Tax=Arsenophonus sp. PmNCSU2021_1 TaxID=3118989 RepID=UPI002FF25381